MDSARGTGGVTMWLTNLTHKDLKALCRCQIFFEVADMEHALQFMRVIRICIVFGVHAGIDWKAISDKYFKKGFRTIQEPVEQISQGTKLFPRVS
ncbi:hypothetical protein E3N88_25850 [Mikania micrantha]|uniref:Uncharacterized protein n=1 Tax=Mikania micrantha TaxID=192012 RepID=A0A5N6N8N2_9ASTR|nr:hypothetical protein E3N88_25850 [Mikania micrantha]